MKKLRQKAEPPALTLYVACITARDVYSSPGKSLKSICVSVSGR